MRLYFDSVYVAKCYLPELDGPRVRQMARGETSSILPPWSSALAWAEMACLFHRQIREKSLARRVVLDLQAQFREDVDQGVWTLWPVSDALLGSVDAALRQFPAEIFLRAGDAVHLLTARHAGFTEIWSNDRHLLRAAPHFGLQGRSL